MPIGGIYFLTPNVIGEPNLFRCPFDSPTSSFNADCAESWYLTSFAPAAYRTCRIQTRRNHTSCHQLANMCVLNLYGYAVTTPDRIDVCRAFDDVYASSNGFDMPWLRYPESYGEYKNNYLQNGIQTNSNSEYLKVT